MKQNRIFCSELVLLTVLCKCGRKLHAVGSNNTRPNIRLLLNIVLLDKELLVQYYIFYKKKDFLLQSKMYFLL